MQIKQRIQHIREHNTNTCATQSRQQTFKKSKLK